MSERPNQRQVLLAGGTISYELQRARRRSIGFIVSDQGLVVRAPGWATLSVIESALHEKSGWITRKLADVGQRQARQQAARIVWADGGQLPWLGGVLTLRLGALQRTPEVIGAELHAGLPALAPGLELRQCVLGWFQRQARLHFAQRLAHFAPLLGVQPARLMLTSAATRWGSASASGTIRLNWRLMHHRPEVIDYVVVHELAHLREMNHGPRFWAIVAAVTPEHLALRRELRQSTTPVW